MIALDEEAFICDMAETYHIFNYRELPGRLLGTLAAGLRDDSRIKMKANGVKAGTDTLLLANVLDVVRYLLWAQTKDAEKGRNKPKCIAEQFYAKKKVDHSHDLSPNQYEQIRNRILSKRSKK